MIDASLPNEPILPKENRLQSAIDDACRLWTEYDSLIETRRMPIGNSNKFRDYKVLAPPYKPGKPPKTWFQRPVDEVNEYEFFSESMPAIKALAYSSTADRDTHNSHMVVRFDEKTKTIEISVSQQFFEDGRSKQVRNVVLTGNIYSPDSLKIIADNGQSDAASFDLVINTLDSFVKRFKNLEKNASES